MAYNVHTPFGGLLTQYEAKMTTELQSEQPVAEGDAHLQQDLTANHDNGPESAPGTGEAQEQSTSPENNQEAINEAINRQHKKFRDEERKRIEIEQQLQEAQSQLQQYQTTTAPEVPAMPDAFDDDFEQKIKARDEAIASRAAFDAQQAQSQQMQQQQQQAALQQQQQQLAEKVGTYTTRARELGVNEQELAQAGQVVASYGVSDDLTMAILDDADGPLITKYLASNPLELDSLRGMSTYQAAIHINGAVRQKAAALKPQQTNAPAPAETLTGVGVDPDAGKYKFSKGAIFE